MTDGRSGGRALRPVETIQRILLSTTSRLFGEFSKEGILISHAWPAFDDDHGRHRWTQGPMSRSTYVLSFETPSYEKRPGVVVPDYGATGDFVAATMSVLYGKRFDSHGSLENSGSFRLPNTGALSTPCLPDLPHNTHSPRPDFGIPLNLVEAKRLLAVWDDDAPEDPKAVQAFVAASRFYQRALQAADTDAEAAYLHLITAGEIISNEYLPRDRMLDDDLEAILKRVSEALENGPADSKLLRSRLFEVKRRFVTTYVELIDSSFFERREAVEQYATLQAANLGAVIGAAYDLRSQFMHRGELFGTWMRSLHGNNEVQLGQPVVPDKDQKKALAHAPTLVGLERATRYVILRFAEARIGIELKVDVKSS